MAFVKYVISGCVGTFLPHPDEPEYQVDITGSFALDKEKGMARDIDLFLAPRAAKSPIVRGAYGHTDPIPLLDGNTIVGTMVGVMGGPQIQLNLTQPGGVAFYYISGGAYIAYNPPLTLTGGSSGTASPT